MTDVLPRALGASGPPDAPASPAGDASLVGEPTSPLGQVVAIVPARGGSKGVPRKNLRPLGGEPLVARAVRSLRAARTVDTVVVSTDDHEIAFAARAAGARVVMRPAWLADDEASSEAALRHALAHLATTGPLPDVTVFAQATSPFIGGADVDRAVDTVRSGRADVAFSVARAEQHLWRVGPDGPVGVNHDLRRRLRRQDRDPEFVETGAFYVMGTSGFLEHGHRFFGRIELVEVDVRDAIEIHTPHDLRMAEEMVLRRAADATDPAACPLPARAVATDFDGVHTDDTLRLDEHGVESVVVSRAERAQTTRVRLCLRSNPCQITQRLPR